MVHLRGRREVCRTAYCLQEEVHLIQIKYKLAAYLRSTTRSVAKRYIQVVQPRFYFRCRAIRVHLHAPFHVTCSYIPATTPCCCSRPGCRRLPLSGGTLVCCHLFLFFAALSRARGPLDPGDRQCLDRGTASFLLCVSGSVAQRLASGWMTQQPSSGSRRAGAACAGV